MLERIRNFVAFAAAVTVAVAFPVAALCDENQGLAVTDLNNSGFAAFSSLDDTTEYNRDVGLSPTLSWYVHRFMKLSKEDLEARDLLTVLRKGGLKLDGEMAVDRSLTSYSNDIARYANADFGIKTTHNVGDIVKYGFVFQAVESLSVGIPCFKGEDFARGGFYERGSLRAVRLESQDSKKTLFLFFDTNQSLNALRKTMSLTSWTEMSSGFTQTGLHLADFDMNRSPKATERSSTNEGFGEAFEPVRFRGDAYRESANVHLSVCRAEFSGKMTANAFTPPDVPFVSIDGIPELSKTVDISVPMIYVVRDNVSGAIEFLGEHG